MQAKSLAEDQSNGRPASRRPVQRKTRLSARLNADNAVCDVEELKAGVYVVRIHTEGTVVSQRKFVKE